MPQYTFEPKNSEVFSIANKEKVYNQILFCLLRGLIWILGGLSAVVWIFDFFKVYEFDNFLLGFGLIIISLALAVAFINNFYQFLFRHKSKILTPDALQKEGLNLAQYVSLETAKAIKSAKNEAHQKKSQVIDTIFVFLAMLKNLRINYILARAGANLGQYGPEFQDALSNLDKSDQQYSQKFLDAIKEGAKIAMVEKHDVIEIGDLFYGLCKKDEFLQKMLFKLDLKPEDIANIVYWEDSVNKEVSERKKLISADFLERTGGIGRQWAFGYTPNLSRYSYDLSEAIKRVGLGLHIIGHRRTIDEIERILSRSGKNNVILIGEPGVGKKTTVLGFVQRVLKGRSLKGLRDKHLIQLDLGRLLSGEMADIEAKLVASLNEAVSAGNIILFCEDIHSLFGGGVSKIGAIDASEILIPYLQSSQLQLIGTTSYAEYHKYIEASSGLASNFERIEVGEPTETETIRILEDAVPAVESRDKVIFSYQSLKEIVALSKRYIQNKPFPEKAIDLMDEIAVYVATKTKDKMVSAAHAQKVVSEKTKIPTEEVGEEEKAKLLKLEEFLHERVIDQNEAIKAISEAMRRARVGLKSETKPIGSFLFLGPTGVGKTETARALAANYFGSEKAMSRLDMSEYKTPQALDRLIGTADGGEGVLTSQIKENPYCLLFLDEIEKAHGDVLNLFLQVLEDGRLTDRLGRTVDFTNTIIIATSNAGAELIRESIKKGVDFEVLREKLLEYLQSEGIFKPEFLNRFDGIVSFKPLSLDEIYQVASLMLQRLTAQMKAEKEIEVSFSQEAVHKLAELGYNPEMGARPMRRTIQDKVENWLAEKMLKNEIQRGQKVEFGIKDIR